MQYDTEEGERMTHSSDPVLQTQGNLNALRAFEQAPTVARRDIMRQLHPSEQALVLQPPGKGNKCYTSSCRTVSTPLDC